MISQSEKHRMHPRGIGLQQYMGLEGWPMPVIPPSPYKGSALQTDPFSQCCRNVLIEQHDVTPACIKIHYQPVPEEGWEPVVTTGLSLSRREIDRPRRAEGGKRELLTRIQ